MIVFIRFVCQFIKHAMSFFQYDYITFGRKFASIIFRNEQQEEDPDSLKR